MRSLVNRTQARVLLWATPRKQTSNDRVLKVVLGVLAVCAVGLTALYTGGH